MANESEQDRSASYHTDIDITSPNHIVDSREESVQECLQVDSSYCDEEHSRDFAKRKGLGSRREVVEIRDTIDVGTGGKDVGDIEILEDQTASIIQEGIERKFPV